jgi:hypothetical protein
MGVLWSRGSGGCLLDEGLTSVLAHLLNLLAAPARAHSAGVAIVVLLLLELDVRAVARDDDGAARLSASQARAHGGVTAFWVVLVADRRAGGGGAHVVGVGCPAVDVSDSDSRVGGELGKVRHVRAKQCGSLGFWRGGRTGFGRSGAVRSSERAPRAKVGVVDERTG